MTSPYRESGQREMGLGQRLQAFVTDTGAAGIWPLLVLMALAGVQNFDLVAFGVLSPDIRDTFGLSNAGIDAIASLTAAVPVAFAVFLGYFGDRTNRVRLTTFAAVLYGAMAVLTGLAPALAVLVIARIAGGTGFLSSETISPSLLSDYYPPKMLGSVFGTYRFGSYGLSLVGAGLAGVMGSVIGWRATYVLLALPTLALVVGVRVLLREPERGAVQGLSAGGGERERTIGESFRRIRAIRTLRRTWTAAFLFGAGTLPFSTLLSTFFKDVYHQGDAARGVIATVYGLGGLLGIGIGAWLSQRVVRTGELRKLALINGLMILEFAVGIVLMAGVPVFAVSVIAAGLLSIGAFGFLPAYTTLVSVVAPARVRAQAFGWSLLFYSLGAVVITPIVGSVGDAHGQRAALLLLAGLVAAGGLVGASCAALVDRDVEQATRAEGASKSEALLSCSGVDAGYGGVQVLFGVDFEIGRGEMVALLGTNGAGKSTFLKAITGLVEPSGGSIFFSGRDITHTDPAATARLGIMAMPGGRGVFPTLSVADNLKVAGWLFRKDKDYLKRATDQVVEYFPVLAERSNTMAGDLSGGEQQMLSLAQAFIAEPKLLLIDELSLGLAPAVVERLIEIVRQIHAKGVTVILVEQSVSTALQLAERATFMEKGEVRFSGPTTELLDRPDILRAVFLQGAGTTSASGLSDASNQDRVRSGLSWRRSPETRNAHESTAVDPVVVEARSVSKSYGGVSAVRDVSFKLEKGEILGFIGPNGAGKTTLFDLVSGFATADQGSVFFGGADVTRWPAYRRAARGLGRSFQDARLWPGLTVAECLAVALHREGEISSVLPALLCPPRVADSEELIHEGVDELIEFMHLEAYRNKFASELSTGSRRVVELGCMLASRPTVLILDEPSSGISQRETEALLPLLRDIRNQLECSVLIIEHDIPLISSLADRLVALDLGRVISAGRPAQVLSDDYVIDSFLGSGAEKLRPSPSMATTNANDGHSLGVGQRPEIHR